MSKDELARKLIIEEIKKENGRFVTTRIIDRLALMHASLFDREFLARIAETLNQEGLGRACRGLAAAVNQ
jgi:hypothetical protein